MCGINGILNFDILSDSEHRIRKMNQRLAHRGPDNEGIYADEHIALGHRRLAIIDLSDAGNQPMFCENKRFVIVYNGEIYNFKEIKQQLKDYCFKTNTDTEVILAAYSTWKENCLNHFKGMFAFAIWDKFKKALFIARDRLGIKPIYYYKNQHHVIFSSELRSLVESGLIPKKINNDSVIDFLRYQTVHAPDTILKDIQMLMPGHFMTISERDFNIKKYWDITENYQRNNYGNYDQIKQNIYHLLLNAVERRMIADVPFGAFLSGGIDSSIVVGLMSQVANTKINTFSITFDEAQFNEAEYSNIIANKFNTNHTEIHLSPNEFLNLLPDALNAMDHPSGDGPNTYVVSKVTKNSGITMALSGLGGDELFAGYDIFKRMVKLQKYKLGAKLPGALKNIVGEILKKFKPSVASEKIAEILKSEEWEITNTYPLFRQLFSDNDIRKILNCTSLTSNNVFKILNKDIDYNKPGYNLPLLSKISYAEINTYLQNILLRDTDQMSMASALEVRVPFLDHELVEYVFGVPDKYKYPHTPKKLLVDAMGDFLPDKIVHRPKMGFIFPWANWLKNELYCFCTEKINNLSQRNGFAETEIRNLWDRFLHNDPVITWSRVWNLIVLEHWLEQQGIDG